MLWGQWIHFHFQMINPQVSQVKAWFSGLIIVMSFYSNWCIFWPFEGSGESQKTTSNISSPLSSLLFFLITDVLAWVAFLHPANPETHYHAQQCLSAGCQLVQAKPQQTKKSVCMLLHKVRSGLDCHQVCLEVFRCWLAENLTGSRSPIRMNFRQSSYW